MGKEDEIITEEVVKETAPIEDKVKEDAPVVEDVIIDKKEDEGEGEKEKEFDVNAFSDKPAIPKEEVKEEVVAEEVVADDDDGSFKWAEYSEEEEVAEVVATTEDDKPVIEEVVSDNNGFQAVAKELGLKFENIDEFKEHLVKLEEDNNKLRQGFSAGATNENIDKLKALSANTDEDLVRKSLEKEGFAGDKLETAVSKYIDNDMLDIEAQKIRNTINKAIVTEQAKITQSTVEADAKQQKEYEESVKSLGEHIKGTKTMFGLEMAKDEESLGKVQQGHFKYIESGKFMDEVFKDDQSLTEASWLWRNRDTIMKAIANSNLQKGKAAILDDIRNPEVIKSQRFKDPKGSDEFDPKVFTYGASKNKK